MEGSFQIQRFEPSYHLHPVYSRSLCSMRSVYTFSVVQTCFDTARKSKFFFLQIATNVDTCVLTNKF
jgi:hypothetical protein